MILQNISPKFQIDYQDNYYARMIKGSLATHSLGKKLWVLKVVICLHSLSELSVIIVQLS